MELTFDVMYQAILNKDVSFEGLFFTAVKTTGIFCRPSCTAKKPHKQNVEFLFSTKEAFLKGYRPCEICHPLESIAQEPKYIIDIIREIINNPSIKIKDADLRTKKIQPALIRRWFLKNHGITFHAFQRMYRINHAFKKIQKGEMITDVALDSGYDSLSGFQESFKNLFGLSPNNTKDINIIDLDRIETPLGTMITCANNEGICLLEFSDRKMLGSEFKFLVKKLNAVILPGKNKHIDLLKKQLKEYFSGLREEFSVPLFTIGSEFQKEVWNILQKIPYGRTISYKEQSIMLKKEKAVRAVANANGMNMIAIVIPCHRVIGSNGQLTGYGGGLFRKQFLLELEKKYKNH